MYEALLVLLHVDACVVGLRTDPTRELLLEARHQRGHPDHRLLGGHRERVRAVPADVVTVVLRLSFWRKAFVVVAGGKAFVFPLSPCLFYAGLFLSLSLSLTAREPAVPVGKGEVGEVGEVDGPQ